jgi:hypothetical protein
MKTFDVVPSVCKEENSKWEGKVTLRKFSFDEKFQFIQGMDVDIKDDGEVESYKTMQQIDRIRKMVSMSAKFYVAVDLKNKETGDVVNSFEDMSYEDDLHNAMIEIASKLVEGFKVGNG